MDRRKFILNGATAATITIAGCAQEDDEEEPEPLEDGEDPKPEEDDDEDGEDSEPEEDDDEDGEDPEAEEDEEETGDGPEAVTEELLRAGAEGDVEKQEQLLHEAHTQTPLAVQEEPSDLTIHEIEKAGVEEFAEEFDSSSDAMENELEDIIEDIGADDYAIVYWRIETSEYGEEERFVVVLDDDGWKPYHLATETTPLPNEPYQ